MSSAAPVQEQRRTMPSPARRSLIVNADDFGFNREITDGIVEAHQNGVVTSTTLMVNMPAAEYAAQRAEALPKLSVGLHMNLTAGRPLSDPSEVPSLVDDEGTFHNHSTFFRLANLCRLDTAELELEMRRQLQRIHDLGIEPTHADSHHHAASCVQPFFTKLRLLREFGIKKMRTHRGWYYADKRVADVWANRARTWQVNLRRAPFRLFYEFQHLICRWRGIKTPTERYSFNKVVSDREMGFSTDCIASFIDAMPKGVNELCCHPGYLSDDPLDEPEFRVVRPQELDFFTNPRLRDELQRANIELISYREF